MLDAFSETKEYGVPVDPVQTPRRYGWLGAHQRSTDSVGGIVLMGVRLYNPHTGTFLTPDPILGGNATPYDYCFGDPINCTDLSGLLSDWVKDKLAYVAGKVAWSADKLGWVPFCKHCDIASATGTVGAAILYMIAGWETTAKKLVVKAVKDVGFGALEDAMWSVYKAARKPIHAVFGYRAGQRIDHKIRRWAMGGFILSYVAGQTTEI